MHLLISFFVTSFVPKMGARPGSAKEPLIPFNVQKWTFCLIGYLSSINDGFKRGCATGDHSFKHGCFPIYPFPKRQILDSSKLKEFADDNFKFYQNGREFSKWMENTVGKGEIARFSFSYSVFKRPILQTRKNRGLFGKGLNTIPNNCVGENSL